MRTNVYSLKGFIILNHAQQTKHMVSIANIHLLCIICMHSIAVSIPSMQKKGNLNYAKLINIVLKQYAVTGWLQITLSDTTAFNMACVQHIMLLNSHIA